MDYIKRYGKLLPVIKVDSEIWDKMTKALQKESEVKMDCWKSPIEIKMQQVYENLIEQEELHGK